MVLRRVLLKEVNKVKRGAIRENNRKFICGTDAYETDVEFPEIDSARSAL